MTDDSNNLIESRRELLESLNEEFRAEGFDSKTYLVYGNRSYDEIKRIASEEDVSMIIMGSQGKKLTDRLLKGSVSKRVIKNSEKPVLVVR